MKAYEWIDRVKAARGWPSDYRVAKELGITPQTISMMRSSSSAMDEKTSISVATALGELPEAVYLDQLAERTKSPSLRTALSAAATRLCILCKVTTTIKLIAASV